MQRIIPRLSTRTANSLAPARHASSLTLSTTASKVDKTAAQWLKAVVTEHEHVDALVAPEENVKLTYTQVAKQVDAYSQGFLGLLVKKGDTFGVLYGNSAVPLVISLSLAQVGVKCVMASPDSIPSNLGSILSSHKLNAFIFPPTRNSNDLIEAVAEVVEEYRYLPYGQAIKSAKFPDLKFAFQGGAYRSRAIVKLADVPVYDPMPSTVAKNASKVTPKDDALELVADSTANGKASKKAVSHSALLSGAAKLAKDIGLARSDRVCNTLDGTDGTSFLIQLATMSQGGVTVLPGSLDNLTTFTDTHLCKYLVLPAAATNQVASAESLDTVENVIVVGDASVAADGIKHLEGSGKKVFTVQSGF